MVDIIASITSAIGLAKQLIKLADESKNVEMKAAVASLTVELADLKMQLAELMNENTDLKQTLKEISDRRAELEFRDGLYFDPEGGGPYCPACFDSNRKSIHLVKQKGAWVDFGEFKCPICDKFFNS